MTTPERRPFLATATAAGHVPGPLIADRMARGLGQPAVIDCRGDEFVKCARANPTALNCASAGSQ